jgi:stearoyl-CoA desaturase (Delta-9 desaturase)
MPDSPTMSPTPAPSTTDAHHHSHDHSHDDHGPSRTFKLVNLLAVVLPFVALLAVMISLWNNHFGWTYLGLMVAFYLATAAGITVGFHRLFTHRAFETPKPIKAVFAILGSMAVQGPLLKWVAEHRRHHQHSDHEGDPHSPHLHGNSWWDVIRGAFHSHVGWIIWSEDENYDRYVGDLRKDRFVTALSNLFPLWVVLGLIAPAVLGGLITMSWKGALLGFIWGGLARIFLVHHVTWSVNSICHIWGAKEFQSKDESRNNPIVGVLALGEGWHNTHHAFPTSARHGLSWWQIDISYYVICTLGMLGLAWNIKVPSPAAIAAKRGPRPENEPAE